MQQYTDKPSGSTIKSLRSALWLLELVGTQRNGARVKDLSAQTGINMASVSKMLSTMAAHDFVRQDPATRRYLLGYKLVELSSQLIEGMDIRAAARPILERLESSTDESVNLASYHIGDLVFIDKCEGTRSLRMHSKIGSKAGWTYTSVGKAVFAWLPDNEQSFLLERFSFEPKTQHSIMSKKVYLDQISETREKGYAVDLEENEPGIMCVGAAVLDYSGQAAGGVSISWPIVRGGLERLPELGSQVQQACMEISKAMGYKAAQIAN